MGFSTRVAGSSGLCLQLGGPHFSHPQKGPQRREDAFPGPVLPSRLVVFSSTQKQPPGRHRDTAHPSSLRDQVRRSCELAKGPSKAAPGGQEGPEQQRGLSFLRVATEPWGEPPVSAKATIPPPQARMGSGEFGPRVHVFEDVCRAAAVHRSPCAVGVEALLGSLQ